jgi:methylated-DNA-[protein]-cysteine S-methyltransferase
MPPNDRPAAPSIDAPDTAASAVLAGQSGIRAPRQAGVAAFDTAIGRCAVVWNDVGLVGVQLPEASPQALQARLRDRFPDAREADPPEAIAQAIGAIGALLRGEPADLSGIVLDLSTVPPFHRDVYRLARAIAPGMTATYGELATRLGDPGLARAVGHALGRNPFAIVVPCHRVLAAGGRSGGFSAQGGVRTKLRLLDIERAQVPGTSTLF